MESIGEDRGEERALESGYVRGICTEANCGDVTDTDCSISNANMASWYVSRYTQVREGIG